MIASALGIETASDWNGSAIRLIFIARQPVVKGTILGGGQLGTSVERGIQPLLPYPSDMEGLT
jgi:hypothetical protein